jgi:hypothetical protein
MSEVPKLPKELEAMADIVLAYKPKPKTKAAKKRKKAAKRAKTSPT